MKRLFLLLILLLFIIGACATKTAPTPIIEDGEQETSQNQTQETQTPRDSTVPKNEKLPELTRTLRTCSNDGQCVRINADCCGCTAGGKAAAINKEYEENWEDTIESKCEDVACTAVMSNDWTCFAPIKCVLNKCTLVKED